MGIAQVTTAATALTNAATAATGLANLILVTPNTNVGYQPQNTGSSSPEGSPLLFHYEGEQTISLQSDITDHFVEDNTAIQDQIALRPEVITTHGYIGELNDVAPYGLQTAKLAAEKLTIIDAYTPALSATAILAYNEALLAYQIGAAAYNAGVSAWDTFNKNGMSVIENGTISEKNAKSQTKQAQAFQQFYGYWRRRTLFTVQTPWAIFKNCAILTVRAIQAEDTNEITDFDVQFKVMRFATTQKVAALASNANQGRAAYDASEEVDFGTQPLGTQVIARTA